MPSLPTFATLLAALAMLGPFSIDSYLPAFPSIISSLSTTALAVQQTLTAYLVSFATMILLHGAVSDAYGRRRPILVSLMVFMAGSIGCVFSPNIGALLAFRMLQGMSAGAGVVIGRAMIRDAYPGPSAERLMALVTMIFAIGPAIAPVLGGVIVTSLGWRAIFGFIVFYTLLLLCFSFMLLPETLEPSARKPLRLVFLVKSYWRIFSNRRFHCYAGTVAFNFGGLFLYVAAAPSFLLVHLKLNPHQFFWQFGPTVGGIFLGALAVNRLAGRIRLAAQVRVGFVMMCGAALFNLIYHLNFEAAIPWSVAPLFFYCFGMSLVAPGVTLMVLDLFPDIRGIAASSQSATLTMLGAVIAGLIAPLLAPSVVWLALGQCGFVVLAWLCWRMSGFQGISKVLAVVALARNAPGPDGKVILVTAASSEPHVTGRKDQ
jgi:DHA1 family bicyclomycin/chloramphenicol resistance-like MFS transporter